MVRAARRRSPDADLLLVVGHTNVDRTVRVAQLPEPDRTVRIESVSESLGGTAANLALSASAWGVPTAVASRVGADFPSAYLRTLSEGHVETSGLVRVRSGRTPSCLIVDDGRGGQMTFIDQGAMEDGEGWRLPEALLGRTRWLHLSTGDPGAILRALSDARRRGIPVSADPAQEVHYRWTPRDLGGLIDGSEILFGNESEIQAVCTALKVPGPARLVDRVPLIVMTRGAEGARAFSRAGRTEARLTARGRGRPATGAGDAFRGGFYAAWFAGQVLRDCLVAGHRSAARWMRGRGRPIRTRSTPVGRAP
ncbi:MAG TPA: PfkB family carbohydrate kinase [Thermoplasmata archaeon]|nr:PfkB family carbohydrate kinase [Thermoplasmata archaeon]